MTKITNEMIEEMEADSLISELGFCIELNNEFLDRFCSGEFSELIKKIPESDRGYVLQGLTESHWFNGFPTDNDSQDIWLDISEIEYQFEGNPADIFENPQDFTINGDCAYLYVGYGFSVKYNRAELEAAVNSYLGGE